MGIEENKKVVLKLFEAMSKRDINEVLDMLTEDATWWVIGSLPGVSGTHKKQEIPALFKKVAVGIVGGDLALEHLIAEGDYVAAEARAIGSKTLDGKVYDQRYHFKFEIKDGKVRAVRAYNDISLVKEVSSVE